MIRRFVLYLFFIIDIRTTNNISNIFYFLKTQRIYQYIFFTIYFKQLFIITVIISHYIIYIYYM
jgi:hypothetical protein